MLFRIFQFEIFINHQSTLKHWRRQVAGVFFLISFFPLRLFFFSLSLSLSLSFILSYFFGSSFFFYSVCPYPSDCVSECLSECVDGRESSYSDKWPALSQVVAVGLAAIATSSVHSGLIRKSAKRSAPVLCTRRPFQNGRIQLVSALTVSQHFDAIIGNNSNSTNLR